MIKEKPCKGIGVAIGFGCGKLTKVENRIYGLRFRHVLGHLVHSARNRFIKMKKIAVQQQIVFGF